jgi:hypothetical protein
LPLVYAWDARWYDGAYVHGFSQQRQPQNRLNYPYDEDDWVLIPFFEVTVGQSPQTVKTIF